jgi:hypothetical protein
MMMVLHEVLTTGNLDLIIPPNGCCVRNNMVHEQSLQITMLRFRVSIQRIFLMIIRIEIFMVLDTDVAIFVPEAYHCSLFTDVSRISFEAKQLSWFCQLAL